MIAGGFWREKFVRSRLSADSRGQRNRQKVANISICFPERMRKTNCLHWPSGKCERDNTLFTNNLHGPVTFLNRGINP
jgi:hypothetical protein